MEEEKDPDREALADRVLRRAFELADSVVDGQGEPPTTRSLLAEFPGADVEVRDALARTRGYVEALRRMAAGDAAIDLPAGARLGDFEVTGPLGRGGMGVVVRAEQLSLGRRAVALKAIAIADGARRDVARFEREARLLSTLHHPHLAEVHGFGRGEGLLFYAMRLVEGPTLADVLAEIAASGPPDDAERRRIVLRAAEVAEALAEVHRRGLVHRDVKPANVVLEAPKSAERVPDASAVLVDFGLVRPVDAHTLTEAGSSPATLDYAAPEQLLDEELDARCDVFALGATLHDLLAGRRPRERRRAAAGLEPIRELVPEIDRDLAAVVDRACEVERSWRYGDGARLAGDLRAWLRGDPVAARKLRPAERAARWARRHPGRIARGAAAAVALGLLAAGAVLLGDVLSRADRARAQWEEGNLPMLVQTVGGLPGALAEIVLDDPLEAVHVALRDPRPGDPLAAVHAHLREDELSAALLAAARALAVEGVDTHPTLQRFLAAAVQGRSFLGDPRRVQELAAVHLARLFYERQDLSPAQRGESAFLRAALRRAWEDAGATPEARRHLVTALAACGEPGDALRLAGWAAEQRAGFDDRRLGLRGIELILRRSHRSGALGEMPFGELERILGPLFREHLEGRWHHPRSTPHKVEMEELLCALVLAARAAGHAVDVERFVPAGWRSAFDAPGEEVRTSQWVTPLAVARMPEAAAPLRRGPYYLVGDASRWGRLCGHFGDAEVTKAARETCPAEKRAAFDEGLVRARLESLGEKPEYRLDEDTRLDASPGHGGFRPLEHERGPEPAEPVLAKWSYRTDPPVVSGWATGGRTRLAAQSTRESDAPYLRLPRFGRSAVELELLVPEPGRNDRARLVLVHQAAARAYYPDEGQVRLRIMFDEERLAESVLVTQTGADPTLLLVPDGRLTPGRHVIRVEALDTSTAVLWLLRAELQAVSSADEADLSHL